MCAFVDVCCDTLLKVFEENSVFAHEEKLYQPFLSLLKVSKITIMITVNKTCCGICMQTRLDEEMEVFRRENSELIKTSCQAQVYLCL